MQLPRKTGSASSTSEVAEEEPPRGKRPGQCQQWPGVSCEVGPVKEGGPLQCRTVWARGWVTHLPFQSMGRWSRKSSLDEKRLECQCHQRHRALRARMQGLWTGLWVVSLEESVRWCHV